MPDTPDRLLPADPERFPTMVEFAIRIYRLPSGERGLEALVRLRGGTVLLDSTTRAVAPFSQHGVDLILASLRDAVMSHLETTGGLQLTL